MNLTALFIKRPVMTALVMAAIIIFGVAGYRTLPVSDLPNIDYPTMQVVNNRKLLRSMRKISPGLSSCNVTVELSPLSN